METLGRRLLVSNIIVALLGFIDAFYLLYFDLNPNAHIFCPLEGEIFQCATVHNDPHSKLLGIPVSLMGTLFFLIIIIFTFLALSEKNKYWLGFFLPISSLIGVGFSIYLTYIEIFIITVFCEFCLFSALCNLLVLYFVITTKEDDQGSIFANLSFWKMFVKKNDSKNCSSQTNLK